MKTVADLPFPETEQEAANWSPVIRFKALSRSVLVAAKTRIEGKWAAYCDSVLGRRHEHEYQEVLRSGCKLPEEYARAMFPEFDDLPYAR